MLSKLTNAVSSIFLVAAAAVAVTTITSSSTTTTTVVVDAAKLEFPSHLVHAGACFLDEELMLCAMEASECRGGLKYMSFRQLLDEFKDVGNPSRTTYDADAAKNIKHVLNACAGSHSKTNHPGYVGMCTSPVDGYQCTSHKSNCFHPELFVPDVPYCSLQYNYWSERDSSVSLYGSCVPIIGSGQDSQLDYTNIACVWSERDCPPESNQFMVASQYSGLKSGETYEDLCTCDKVMTGACVDKAGKNNMDSGIHSKHDFQWVQCAVSADACDEDSTFIPWQQVQYSGLDCRLCDDFNKEKDVKTGNLPKDNPVSQNGGVPTDAGNQNVISDDSSNCATITATASSNSSVEGGHHHKKNKHTGQKIGILIGGAVLGVVVTLLAGMAVRRYNVKKNKTSKKTTTKVVEDDDETPREEEQMDAVDLQLENGIMS